MDRIVEAFNKYYGWILAFGIIYIVLGALSLMGSILGFDILGIITAVVFYIVPAVIILKFCGRAKNAAIDNAVENIEQACRYQSLFIIIMGVVALIGIIFMIFTFVFGLGSFMMLPGM